MELAMELRENELSSFVQNIEDIEVLFASMTPEVVTFFENSYTTNYITRRIKSLKWPIGDTLEVIGSKNSYLTP